MTTILEAKLKVKNGHYDKPEIVSAAIDRAIDVTEAWLEELPRLRAKLVKWDRSTEDLLAMGFEKGYLAGHKDATKSW